MIFSLVQAYARQSDLKSLVIVEPAFTEYERAAVRCGFSVRHFLLSQKNAFSFTKADLARLADDLDGAGMLFLALPANPTGALVPAEMLCEIAALCEKKQVFFCVDASFSQFSALAEQTLRALLSRRSGFPHVLVLNAFTKFYGMAGLRLGYALCFSETIARMLADSMRPWPVGSTELAAGLAVLQAEIQEKGNARTLSEWEKSTRSLVLAERRRLTESLQAQDYKVIPGEANFILFRSKENDLAQRLLQKGIAIRSCADFYGLDQEWYRIAVRSQKENSRLIAVLDELQGCRHEKAAQESTALTHRAKNIMLQGTMSNAGKSLLTAALCRIFRQDGYRVAPFKSQNMALNSGVTADGLEMGRAQIMQAEAAGLLPDVRMNPVLLKPTGDHTSQVIVNGKAVGTMDAREYFSFRSSLLPQILEAYDSLSRENDIIVIEGAGSPAEINLKKDDIVNMGLAELLDAPVLLAGDIDRGGVFASLYGTAALVNQKERQRIKAFVINKFRGDVSLLQDGLDQIENLTGIPVLGVVPFISGLMIDDEDSLSGQLAAAESQKNKQEAALHIAVLRLPFISNFTDLQTFSRLPFVQVSFFDSFDTYSQAVSEYGEPDMFVIPGTKNTVHALFWLRETKLDRLIIQKAKSGLPTIGICGGFQLLGKILRDEDGNEDEGRQSEMAALGLLPIETSFTKEKTRAQVDTVLQKIVGIFAPLSGCRVTGYEIHQGVTRFFSTDDGEKTAVPSVCVCENVLGTYIHGFFDSDEISRATIALLCQRKGIPLPAYQPYQQERQAAYDRLADLVRKSLNMDAVYKIVFGNKV